MNNPAKYYSNKLLYQGIAGFIIGIWWVIKLWDEINHPLLMLFATANIAWLYICIGLRKKLRQKMKSETGDIPEFPEHSSQYYWAIFILIGLICAGAILLKNSHFALQFILWMWIVGYSVQLYYQAKRINEFLKS